MQCLYAFGTHLLTFTFKLKKPNADTAAIQVAHFSEWPSWQLLASTIADLFNISLNDPIVFSVSSTFVWIDKKQASKDVQSELVKILRSGTKVVHPEYSVVHVGVETVDPKLGSVLGIQL